MFHPEVCTGFGVIVIYAVVLSLFQLFQIKTITNSWSINLPRRNIYKLSDVFSENWLSAKQCNPQIWVKMVSRCIWWILHAITPERNTVTVKTVPVTWIGSKPHFPSLVSFQQQEKWSAISRNKEGTESITVKRGLERMHIPPNTPFLLPPKIPIHSHLPRTPTRK